MIILVLKFNQPVKIFSIKHRKFDVGIKKLKHLLKLFQWSIKEQCRKWIQFKLIRVVQFWNNQTGLVSESSGCKWSDVCRCKQHSRDASRKMSLFSKSLISSHFSGRFGSPLFHFPEESCWWIWRGQMNGFMANASANGRWLVSMPHSARGSYQTGRVLWFYLFIFWIRFYSQMSSHRWDVTHARVSLQFQSLFHH